jgi:gluconolactonase
MALTNEEVFYLSPDRKTLTQVTDDLKKPNGITGTPDGKKLFVSDIRAGQTWRYDIQPDGTLTNKNFFCALGSDGMTIDAEGNVYLTGRGVTVFDPAGKQIDHIDVPEKWSANVCFSGPDRKTLFITASESLYSIQMRVPGANPGK